MYERSKIKIFSDYQSFLSFVETIPQHKQVDYYRKNERQWFGGSYSQALQLAKLGDIETFRKAESIFLEIENNLLPSVESYEIVPYYYGARPNISAVIAGQPKSMYKRQYAAIPAEQGPIRIYLDRFSSSFFTADQIMRRGIAVLALVLALKRIRPVTLYIGESSDVYDVGHSVWATSVDINNIDLSVLANAVANPTFYRLLGFSLLDVLYGKHNGCKINVEKTRKLLDWSDHDLIFEGLSSLDSDTQLAIDDPIKWVKQRLAKLSVKTDLED